MRRPGSLRYAAIALIRFYARYLAPQTGCIYEPVCWQYGIDALRKYGARKGTIMMADRVERCTVDKEAEFHARHACTGCSRTVRDPLV